MNKNFLNFFGFEDMGYKFELPENNNKQKKIYIW